MPVRTAYAPVTGEVLTAANFARHPGGWIGYAEATANQTTITTEVDLTSLTVTVTVGTSRRISITGYALVFSTVANDLFQLTLKEGAAQLQFAGSTPLSTALSSGVILQYVATPTAGSHTYKLTGKRAVGTGSLTVAGSATSPVFILVEDLGPAA